MSNVSELLIKPNGQKFTKININQFVMMLSHCPFRYCIDNNLGDEIDTTVFHIHPSSMKPLRVIGIRTAYFAVRKGRDYYVHEIMVALFAGQVHLDNSKATCSTQRIVLEDLNNVKL